MKPKISEADVLFTSAHWNLIARLVILHYLFEITEWEAYDGDAVFQSPVQRCFAQQKPESFAHPQLILMHRYFEKCVLV